jgi:hypothetical protein
MSQVAEELVAEWIISDVLDETTAVSKGVGLAELGRGGRWEAFQKQRLDLVFPENIDEFLVREQGISRTGLRHTQKHASQQQYPGGMGEGQQQGPSNEDPGGGRALSRRHAG